MQKTGILAIGAVLFMLVMAGCHKITEPSSAGEFASGINELQFIPNETFHSPDPDNENLADMLQKNAAGVVVRISTQQWIGSGVIWKMEEDVITILTASHVLKDAESLQITFIDGTSIEESGGNEWEWKCSLNTDIALIKIPIETIPKETLRVCRYAAVNKEVFDQMSCGDRILVMGSADDVAANAYEGTLTETWIYVQDYQQYMMLGRTYALSGMSGGGVFDEQGYFIGILSGADDEGNLAIVPLSLIWAEE